jgi:glutamyl-tRNA synthetase
MKTRFSPSPPGHMHLGNARTALFSFLAGRHQKSPFLLRIEDTDKTRSKTEYTELLKEDLQWLGLKWNEGPFFQSERQAIYHEYYRQLEQEGFAYPCFCDDEVLALSRKIQLSKGLPPRYAGTCRKLTPEEIIAKKSEGLKPTLRFKVPENQDIHFQDLVKGPQHFRSNDIGDFIIRRGDESASFFFCNAIDDSLMGITHVIRGEDHLTNTPRQLLMLKALKLAVPEYGHIPLILSTEGDPLSKREKSQGIAGLREQGYLPIALNNYMGRLGHYYTQTHLMSLEELATHFALTHIGKTPAHFDEMQLMHWQKQAVMQLSDEDFWQWLLKTTQARIPEAKKLQFITLIRPNILFPDEADHWAKILFSSFSLETPVDIAFLHTFKTLVETHGDDYQTITKNLSTTLSIKGKALFQPLRLVLTGETHGPELQGIFKLLGQEGLLEKIKHSLRIIM